MDISEFEKKRAANLIWNGANDYSIEPGFRVFDEDGRADLYWNSIVGAIHLHYDWEKLQNFYRTFHEKIDQTAYESFFWLALENAAFAREKDIRPVFPYLREQYARRKVEALHGEFSLEDSAGQRVLAITLGHFRRALGMDANLPDMVDIKLLDALEIDGAMTTDEIIRHLTETLERYFTYRYANGKISGEGKGFHPFRLIFMRRRKGGRHEKLGPVRHLAFGYGEHISEYGSEVLDQSHLSVAFAQYTGQTDEGLREYITNYFGNSMYDKKQVRKLEKDYCTGNHTDVKLHFTRGDYTEKMLEQGFAGKMHKEALAQAEHNRVAYQKKETIYRLQIDRLTARIRNSMLVYMDDQEVKSNAGQIDATKIWRALELNDDRVFRKIIKGNNGNISVDILLDASTSQLHRQEIVAAQAHMLAESLTRCQIPVKVYSFSSLNGYTVVNLFRDYQEYQKNREIFRYFSTGANRDGLAIRLAAGMIRQNHAEHRILIVLSDCQPNDVIKMRTSSGVYKDYAADAGVEDTAMEVHQARLAGIDVLCVFTGEDKALPSVRRIYGRNFARIRELDMFADTVGTLLQNRIRML